MTAIFVIIHIVVCIALIMIVLLQTGKGADMGAAFGGGSSQTLFGNTGATFLGKLTTGVAIVFMLTSLSLAYFSSRQTGSSVMSDVKPPAAAEQAVPAAGNESGTSAPETTAQPSSEAPATEPAKE